MNALCERLGIRYPIIQAPMAGGSNTPELVAAVGNAGGLGSFGWAYSSVEKIAQDAAVFRALSRAPLNANLFVFREREVTPEAEQGAAREAFARCGLLARLGLDELPAVNGPFYPDPEAQLAAVLALKPEVVSFHFDLPDEAVVAEVKASGALIGVSATCLADALDCQARGADFVIAQGIEAGGHRGSRTAAERDPKQSTLALISALRGQISLPVVAAGGLMHGRDIAAVLTAGAAAAQLGTAFLTTDESGAREPYRRAVAEWAARPTAFTRAFSGRMAQGIENLLMQQMRDQPVLPFPQQNSLTGPLRAAAAQQGDPELLSLWAGQGFAQARSLAVEALMQQLLAECAEAGQPLSTGSKLSL